GKGRDVLGRRRGDDDPRRVVEHGHAGLVRARPGARRGGGRRVMAPTRTTDPDVETLVESIRTRLLRAPDRAGAVRYVHFVLGGWNGEPLPDRDVADEE